MEQAVKAVLAALALVYLATAIAAPGWFLDRLSLNERDRRKGAARWLLWPTFLLTAGGVCLLIYQAFDPLFAWIPRDWGTIEDGEFFAHRDLWRMTLSFILGVLLVSKVESNAEALVQAPVDKRCRLVLTGAIQEAALSIPGLLNTTGMYVAEGLERSDLELPSAAGDRKDATRKEILHALRDWPQVGPIEK